VLVIGLLVWLVWLVDPGFFSAARRNRSSG
jgi:hypothetical protein